MTNLFTQTELNLMTDLDNAQDELNAIESSASDLPAHRFNSLRNFCNSRIEAILSELHKLDESFA